MKKPQLAKRLRDVRQRERDASAARTGAAEAERLAAERVEGERRDEMEQILDAGATALLQVKAANDLFRLDDERRGAESRIQSAAAESRNRAEEAEKQRDELRRREGKLRASERLLEHALAERARAEDKQEARTGDDLAGARVHRQAS